MKKSTMFLTLVLAGCSKASRSTDTVSSSLPTPEARVAFVCSYALCMSQPVDAAFHVQWVDNSSGFVPGPDDGDVRAVLKVKPDELAAWTRTCTSSNVAARPDWLGPMLAERGWTVASVPDRYRCGAFEERLIHVKEALVVRTVKAH